MSAEDGKIEAAGPEMDPLTPREQAQQEERRAATTEDLLAAILAGQQETNTKLDALAERVEAVEKQGAGTIALPEGIPEPNGIEYPLWDDMDNQQRAAWIRAHEGTAPPPPPEGESMTVQLGDDLWAEFPVPPADVKAEWEQFAPTLLENWPREMGIDQPAAVKAYAAGGPLWLAAFGSKAHAWLMELPKPWRVVMVQQVTRYAPTEGAALGRDILKAKTHEARDYGYETNLGYADDRREGIVRRPGPGDAIQKNEW